MQRYTFPIIYSFFFFFFNDPSPTEIYTLSLHDALPISDRAAIPVGSWVRTCQRMTPAATITTAPAIPARVNLWRSEEHTSELQSQSNLVCRLLLEKKKKKTNRQKKKPDIKQTDNKQQQK